ncbi:MAG: 2OG-Fe(II) oxygenase [Actinomycetota bacterium]|nr:2OG-Fe(II) oxygenase [Actinomycetota bacterium]
MSLATTTDTTTMGDQGPTADARLAPHLDDLVRLADERAEAYAAADPFPHTVIDGLFDAGALRRVRDELPARDTSGWTTWDTANERKRVFDRPDRLGGTARRLADELNSSEFVRFLERLSGIGGLVPDPHLTAAGYFDVRTGGFLDVHIDFARNPKLHLVRRINVLVYLNEDWQEDWGGRLELCRTVDGRTVRSIVPVLGRMVIFSTPGAAHGRPEPVRAPGGRSRLCFSAYYFTSPDLPDTPVENHGVLFAERSRSRRATAARFVPPIVLDGARTVRRNLRSRG